MYSLIEAALIRDHLIIFELLNRKIDVAHAHVISARRVNEIVYDLQFS